MLLELPRRSDGLVDRISELTWAPSGASLAFTTDAFHPQGLVHEPATSLRVVDLGRNEARALVEENAEGLVSGPAWSPDGSLIAYGRDCEVMRFGGDVYCDVAVADPSGGQRRVLITQRGRRSRPALGVGFHWRPRSTELVVPEFGSAVAITVIDAATGRARMFRGHGAYDVAISSNGRFVGYVGQPLRRGRSLEVRILDIRNGSLVARRRLGLAQLTDLDLRLG